MNAHFERNGTYPLSSVPAEGYGSDPLTRSGKVILSHINGRYIKLDGDGYMLVEERGEATKFDDHSSASLAAGRLVDRARVAA